MGVGVIPSPRAPVVPRLVQGLDTNLLAKNKKKPFAHERDLLTAVSPCGTPARRSAKPLFSSASLTGQTHGGCFQVLVYSPRLVLFLDVSGT